MVWTYYYTTLYLWKTCSCALYYYYTSRTNEHPILFTLTAQKYIHPLVSIWLRVLKCWKYRWTDPTQRRSKPEYPGKKTPPQPPFQKMYHVADEKFTAPNRSRLNHSPSNTGDKLTTSECACNDLTRRAAGWRLTSGTNYPSWQGRFFITAWAMAFNMHGRLKTLSKQSPRRAVQILHWLIN